MKTIDLTTTPKGIDDILGLARQQSLLVRATDGKVFIVAELGADAVADDFAQEVALTRHNKALRQLLAERSTESAKHTTEQVRQQLGLTPRVQ